MFGKLSVRNIPREVLEALELKARKNDRSVEAEVRQAIKSWTSPSPVTPPVSNRLKAVSERLTQILELNRAGVNDRKVQPSHVAQAIGESHVGEVEDWFLGQKEPSFDQLNKIAAYFGIRSEWLIHGDGSIYCQQYSRIPENVEEALSWLCSWNVDDNAKYDSDVAMLHFVREASETGSLAVLKQTAYNHWRIYRTPYHISEMIGAGGESSLVSLFQMWRALYRSYTKPGAKFSVASYLVSPADFDKLLQGNTNPHAVLTNQSRSVWWEDIWDSSMNSRTEYWPGWSSLSNRINQIIKNKLSNTN